MTHWQAVLSDVWSVLRWVMPLMFALGANLISVTGLDDSDEIVWRLGLFLLFMGFFGTYLAIAGVWV